MSRKLFVGNLSYNTTEDSLQGLFTQVGPVESARVMRDMATGRSRGFGFVEMQSEDDAKTAIDRFNDSELDGRRIAVNVAQPKPAGAGAGSGGRGGFGGQRRREPRW
jgi:cold-inducible RNA-binding protein